MRPHEPPPPGPGFSFLHLFVFCLQPVWDGQMDRWTERQQRKGNMRNHTRALTADIHNSALSLIGNKKYEHQTPYIIKLNIPTLG